MLDKYRLFGQGYFPETLPPCFDGTDLQRCLRGITPIIRDRKFFNRSAELVGFSGTKHDGTRRGFSTSHPVQFFQVCEFVYENWGFIDSQIGNSPFVVSRPKPGSSSADRPIIIPSLSNLTTEASKKLRYSPIIVRADISQFFPSVYTHCIPWVAHGKNKSKEDQNNRSTENYFNGLDYFVQGCQNSETRGLAVGPDAFRIIAEFVASALDRRLVELCAEKIIGGARHVDDFFIGVKNESDAQIVLSNLRQVLGEFHFQINDNKTKIISGLEPLNETWAQNLRNELSRLNSFFNKSSNIIRLFSQCIDISRSLNSGSPLKIFLRAIDDHKIYNINDEWYVLEPYLQRACFHYGHCIDYIFLIVVKRFARYASVDKVGWGEVATGIIERAIGFGHDHEILWSLWLMIILDIEASELMLEKLSRYNNSYVSIMLMTAFCENRINIRPPIKFNKKIESGRVEWLESLVARSSGFTKARFKGDFSEEFEHLSDKNLRLLNFSKHIDRVRQEGVDAISHSRYGYDSDDDNDGSDEGFGFLASDFDVVPGD